MARIEGGRVSLRQYSLGRWFVLAYVISWIVSAPLVASAQRWYERPVSPCLYALGFMGSMVAAGGIPMIIVVLITTLAMMVTNVAGADGLSRERKRIT